MKFSKYMIIIIRNAIRYIDIFRIIKHKYSSHLKNKTLKIGKLRKAKVLNKVSQSAPMTGFLSDFYGCYTIGIRESPIEKVIYGTSYMTL